MTDKPKKVRVMFPAIRIESIGNDTITVVIGFRQRFRLNIQTARRLAVAILTRLDGQGCWVPEKHTLPAGSVTIRPKPLEE